MFHCQLYVFACSHQSVKTLKSNILPINYNENLIWQPYFQFEEFFLNQYWFWSSIYTTQKVHLQFQQFWRKLIIFGRS